MFQQRANDTEAGRAFHVTFNSPQSGYMSVGLRVAGREFATAVSCRPRDSLVELISALTKLARGETRAATVRWNCEPDELDFRFEADGDRLSLTVVHYATHKREEPTSATVFSFDGARGEVLASFRAALEELQADAEVDVFESNWRRKFPEKQLREFVTAEKGGA